MLIVCLIQILTLGIGTIIILLNPRFQGKKYRTFRASTFVCTALSGFVPLIHGCALFGISHMIKQSGMPYYLAEGLILIIGVIFYAESNIFAPKYAITNTLSRRGCQKLSNLVGSI